MTRPHILVRGSKIREILLELEIEYDDEDMVTVQEWDNASIRRIQSVGVWIYNIGNLTVSIVPVNEEQLEMTIPSIVQKMYFKFLEFANENPRLVGLFKSKADELVHDSLMLLHIPAIQLENQLEVVPTKKGYENVRVNTFLISESYEGDRGFHFDIRAMYSLCNSAISYKHIRESLRSSSNMNVLVVLFYTNDERMVGIRTAKLYTAGRARIVGAFACSSGYGMLIQQHTEDLMRIRGDSLFPSVPAHMKRATTFKLSALEDAAGFWKRVGFKETARKIPTV